MNLPPELYGLIAEALRASDKASLRTKTKKDWSTENRDLLSLLLVSKTWYNETIPVLWSEIFLEEKQNDDPTEHQLTKVRNLLARSSSSYATYFKHLFVDYNPLFEREPATAALSSTLEEILSLSTHLQTLRLSCDTHWAPSLVDHLSSLHFPSLKILHLAVVRSGEETQRLLGKFLVRHSGLEEVALQIPGPFPWEDLRDANPLPNLITFSGSLAQLKLLSTSQHLKSIRCSRSMFTLVSRLAFIHELSLLSNPFLNVTHLNIMGFCISLDADTLRALAQSFPSVETIDGLGVTGAFIKFMDTKVETMARCLPKLQKATMYESSRFGESVIDGGLLPTPTDSAVDGAFIRLRRLFPRIISATNTKSEYSTAYRIRRVQTIYLFEKGGTEPFIERMQLCPRSRRDTGSWL
ncbi:hypothetical protein SISSUDRAFT_1133025 [Sistotremastrum suecicum HHB10207 ss-3]|uniref:F-box domain-containing protein n=1 Tax=Sistotremastrum suecicum HHB10207 ss-3 TaxID=1314776 RepID=A0A165XY66_9AGAM|nr:hypothetical protein SISSUDRAFT_1133025 [Sistotremastrum suecicum HHB10207 ss-3]